MLWEATPCALAVEYVYVKLSSHLLFVWLPPLTGPVVCRSSVVNPDPSKLSHRSIPSIPACLQSLSLSHSLSLSLEKERERGVRGA